MGGCGSFGCTDLGGILARQRFEKLGGDGQMLGGILVNRREIDNVYSIIYIYIYYSLHLINVFPNCTTNLKINGIITFKLSI